MHVVDCIYHEANLSVVRKNDCKEAREHWLGTSYVTYDRKQAYSGPLLIVTHCVKGKPFDV